MSSVFRVLELISKLITFPFDWELDTKELYPAFKTLCLQPSKYEPRSFPCPRECGCWHRIIRRHDGTGAVAACDCNPPKDCPDLVLSTEEITPLEVNRPKLGRALCRALDLNSKPAELAPPYTMQIGSWSTDAVPVILTIQSDTTVFHHAVAELVARIRRPFVLISPTADHMTVATQEMLTSAQAALATMESAVTLLPNGTLEPARPPAEIFAQFTPAPSSSSSFSSSSSKHSAIRTPKFALTKGLGVWELYFDGQRVILKHERGIFYVYWLLYHPDETPIHAIDLMAKVPEIYRQQLGLPSITDPATGKSVILESHARLQERSLALDDRQSMRAIYHKQQELEAILDSNDTTEPEKAEALRELEQIYEFLHRQHGRTRDAAQRAALTVRMAIKRLRSHLAAALDPNGTPNLALRSFAEHIKNNILSPSAHDSGRFTYHQSVTWET